MLRKLKMLKLVWRGLFTRVRLFQRMLRKSRRKGFLTAGPWNSGLTTVKSGWKEVMVGAKRSPLSKKMKLWWQISLRNLLTLSLTMKIPGKSPRGIRQTFLLKTIRIALQWSLYSLRLILYSRTGNRFQLLLWL